MGVGWHRSGIPQYREVGAGGNKLARLRGTSNISDELGQQKICCQDTSIVQGNWAGRSRLAGISGTPSAQGIWDRKEEADKSQGYPNNSVELAQVGTGWQGLEVLQ